VDVVLRIDLNLFSMLFATVLFASSWNRADSPFLDYRLFMLMLVVAVFELAMDTIMWTFEAADTSFGRVVLLGSTLLYYVAHPLAPMFYAMYAAHQVAVDGRGLKAKLPLFAIPAAVSALVSLASPFTRWYFSIDSSGVYHHGPLFQVFAAASYVYFFFAVAFVIAKRRAVDDRTFRSLILFPLFPALAGLLQINYYGLVLIWPAIVLSLLIIFINIQQRKLTSDYLTGAYNRRRLDEYLGARVREFREAKPLAAKKGAGSRPVGARAFAGFLADVDDFKAINDGFGHAAGDEALIETVKRIRASLRTEDFLARYAGDEFVAILPLSSEVELAWVVDRVRFRFDSEAPRGDRYRLTLSIGAAVFDPAKDIDADSFIERLDKLMYEEKERKKQSRREAL
jgi:diguanylate cyclase (GGDEF)-like protein